VRDTNCFIVLYCKAGREQLSSCYIASLLTYVSVNLYSAFSKDRVGR